MDKKIEIQGSYSSVANFAMQQNYVPIIRKLIIKNLCALDIKDVDVVITSEPEFIYEWSTRVEMLPAQQPVELDVVNINISPNFLYSLTEKMAGTIFIKVKHDDEILANSMQNIEILAYDEWSGTLIMPEIISAFITPNHEKITEVIIKSGLILQKWCGSPSFTAYQSNNPNTVKMQMAAVYAALQGENITYTVPPASYEMAGQRIRLSDRVLGERMGTCLDLSLLYAGCLEAIGLHPLIIFLKGHSLVGCWLEDQCFAECVQDDISMITKRLADGINEICVVETTCFVAGSETAFDDAVKAGRSTLSDTDKFEFLVDVKRTRGSGIRPIPLRRVSEDGKIIFRGAEFVNKERDMDKSMLMAPKELEVFEKIQHVDKIDITRQQIWERKLLDLSLRNTLVSFRVTKNTIQLMVNGLSELEDALSGGEEFQIMARPKDFENSLRDSKIFEIENQITVFDNLIKTEFANKRIRTFIDEIEVAARITSLYRQAKVSLEENGTNTLYLALGFLKWYESDISEKERYAPIVLIPVDIVRKSAQRGYVIRVRDEEPQMNITLLEMLRQDFGLTIGGLDPLPMDERGVDLKRVFSTVRQAVMEKSRWDVEELAFVGLFSFSQFIMWNDLRNRSEELRKNKIVLSLLSGKLEWEPGNGFIAPDALDSSLSPSDLAVPISADSSQLSAICASGKGSSFVLHGPPGTGKSQTITNIIANALFQGKSVLFIAEKMAALSVVQKRLEAIGLAPFCLELHSNKAKKKDVLDQLERVLEIGKIMPAEKYEEQAKRLHELRLELNSVVSEIHRKRDFGFSLYEAISSFEQYRDYSDYIKFSEEQVKALNPQKYTMWVDSVNQIKIAGCECKGAHNHPLHEFTKRSYSQGIKSEILEELKEYSAILDDFKSNISKLVNILSLKKVKTYKQTASLVRLMELLNSMDFMPEKLFGNHELALLKDRVNSVCQHGRKRDELEKQLTSEFTEEILTFDDSKALQQWRQAEASWFLPKLLGQNKVLKAVRLYSKNPGVIKKDSVVNYINLVSEYKANSRIVDENNSLFSGLFGLIWSSGRPDWDVIAKTYNQAVEGNMLISSISSESTEVLDIRNRIINEVLCNLTGFRQHNENVIKTANNEFNRIIELQKSLSQKAGIDFEKLKNNEEWIEEASGKAKLWTDNLDGLRNWCTYLSVREKAEELGLSNVIAAYENGQVTEEDLMPVFYRGISMACAISVVSSEKCLSSFNGSIFENEISKYRETSREFESLTKDELVARLSAKVPSISSGYANSSEIGILQKAIRSGGRMLSIRKLFDSIPNLLRKLCPCMLMSPISVAQYIDPKFPTFDLIVFDEASQMPTCEAVGALARGNDAIIVGDPKQLPPTSFFSVDRTDEDNYEKEDLESILDDCLALSMPQEHLLWHYRSRHESLIAFSNIQYYNNKLFTFPSPNDLISKVKYVQLEGYYDRGKTKQNRAEAEAVVSEILRRLSDPELSRESIGVVTFSSVQQNLIDDLLVEAFAKDPQLEEINNQSYEPIFIKNLENVQGDERDVILFSVGYGPDSSGKVALNFGPVNREGGWRRLNVAVSRARKEMIVFSTLRPEQIDLGRTTSQGVAGLKAFLEFAQKGKAALPQKLANISVEKDMVEKLIAERIKGLGYEVHTNIGCSEYKIDIGIVHPVKKGEYVLGIMCDGRNYHAASTARDRNILQESVLKSLGWNIYRLWILDWWENPDKELQKIGKAIEAVTSTIGKGERTETVKVPAQYAYVYKKADADREEYPAVENVKYSVCALESVGSGAEEFYLPGNNIRIFSQIESVLKAEAPISKNLLQRRILASWGIARLGAGLNRRFEELFKALEFNKTISNNTEFYWNKGQSPKEYQLFRVPADEAARRNMEDIAPEEIANAIKYILKNQVSLSKPDLVKEVYKIFGFSRGNSSIEDAVYAGLDIAVSKEYVSVDSSDRVVIK